MPELKTQLGKSNEAAGKIGAADAESRCNNNWHKLARSKPQSGQSV